MNSAENSVAKKFFSQGWKTYKSSLESYEHTIFLKFSFLTMHQIAIVIFIQFVRKPEKHLGKWVLFLEWYVRDVHCNAKAVLLSFS